MTKEYFECEYCKKRVKSEAELRKENWIRIKGGSLGGIEIWLCKPIKLSYMYHLGWQSRTFDFCSIKCLRILRDISAFDIKLMLAPPQLRR